MTTAPQPRKAECVHCSTGIVWRAGLGHYVHEKSAAPWCSGLAGPVAERKP